MERIRTDKRQIVFEPDPEGIAEVQALCHTISTAQLRLAKVLERLHQKAAFLAEQCSDVGQLVALHGLPHAQGKKLRLVGHAMEAFDWVEGFLGEGKTDLDRAAELGRLTDYEGTLEEGDDWQHRAVFWSLTKLRNEVSRRVEEATQKQKLVSFHAWITENAKADFDRAQTLASRKKQKKLTRGAALGAIFRDYVERHDPQEKTPGKRRIGDTSSPDCRTVPAEVEHEVRRRCGDKCCVPGCQEDVFLERAHDKANRDGGSQEAHNTHIFCHRHHVMFDAGEMWIIGTGSTGLPVFETKDGKILHPDFPNRVMKKSKDQPSERGTAPDAVCESGFAYRGEALKTRSHGFSVGGATISGDRDGWIRHRRPPLKPAAPRTESKHGRVGRSARAPPG